MLAESGIKYKLRTNKKYKLIRLSEINVSATLEALLFTTFLVYNKVLRIKVFLLKNANTNSLHTPQNSLTKYEEKHCKR